MFTQVQYIVIIILSFVFMRMFITMHQFKRDRKRIIDFLFNGKKLFPNAASESMTTKMISAHTELSQDRVRYICSKEDVIVEKEDDQWELIKTTA